MTKWSVCLVGCSTSAGERAFSSSVVSRNVQAWNLSNVLHGQDYQYVTFYPRKTRKSRQFWQQLKNGGCFTHIFWTYILNVTRDKFHVWEYLLGIKLKIFVDKNWNCIFGFKHSTSLLEVFVQLQLPCMFDGNLASLYFLIAE